MPFISQQAKLKLSEKELFILKEISCSRTEGISKVQRSQILLAYYEGKTVSSIARHQHTNRPKVERCINKALEYGVITALNDLPRKGRTPSITPEAKAWVISVACTKPKEIGYASELWTTRSLAKHIREHCYEHGHPSLSNLARGTVSKILSKSEIKPHKISYYVERRDPQFEAKMTQVLHTYKQVEILKECLANGEEQFVAVLSYDTKPGIQAIENTAPDLPPVPGIHPYIGRDDQYKRHGTVSLLAAIDLLSGDVHGIVRDKHRSKEFIEFLQELDFTYPQSMKIRMVLDNHSAHTSKETRRYLSTVPNRFEFIFTPTHGSWLNIIETFFSKMARSFLRGIRVKSKMELKQRILKYLLEINEAPIVFKWKYKLDEISVRLVT